MTTRIKNGDKILFIGDSITDCGRRGAERPLGNGYVKIFNDFLISCEPEKRVEIINKGIGGDRVPGLLSRWGDDVLRHKPDWLSIKIGINDLYTHLRDPASGVSPEKFEEDYRKILRRTRRELPRCKILLIQPFYITRETSRDSFRRQVLDILPQYLKIVARMSGEYKTRLLKTHAMFQKLLKYYEPDTFCNEPVHPNLTGHVAIASAVYDIFCGKW
ncbi:MAG: SGNH/GDSL hydrolase family protein [Kiritimatiellae bacterium]|nr:SGNH/GDSL hydrolase family protein [Kiritimatiellia bacterium]